MNIYKLLLNIDHGLLRPFFRCLTKKRTFEFDFETREQKYGFSLSVSKRLLITTEDKVKLKLKGNAIV